MKKIFMSIIFALALFFGFQANAEAATVNFYKDNGGESAGTMTNVFGMPRTITVAQPTKDGYTFASWSTNSFGLNINGNTISYTGFGQSASAFATWNPVVYNITYVLNDGVVEGNPETYTIEDEDITLVNPTKDGYDFDGWMEEEENLGTEVVIPTGSFGNRNFTALFTAINYNIEYDLDGGTLSEENPSSYTIEDSFTLNNPTKEGYTFKGWIGTDLESQTTEVTVEEGSTGDRSYVAVWEKDPEKKETETANPKTGDNVLAYMSMFGLSLVGMVVSSRKFILNK